MGGWGDIRFKKMYHKRLFFCKSVFPMIGPGRKKCKLFVFSFKLRLIYYEIMKGVRGGGTYYEIFRCVGEYLCGRRERGAWMAAH